MAEYTKIETARAIICDFCNQLYSDEPCEPADCGWLRMLEEDAADVAPVVHCKDCEYSYDEISYLCCSHGVCVDCEVPPNFYCAEGKRKENDE